MNLKPLLGAACVMICMACLSHRPTVPSLVTENVEFAKAQLGLAIDTIEASGKCPNPVTLDRNGFVYYCGYADWHSGFFPGNIWYLYELTGDISYLPLARKHTEAIRLAEHLTWHHDIGFIINCSFGNGLRLVPDTAAHKGVMVRTAKSLCTRLRPNARVIQSQDVEGNSWQSERGRECPVIIDNMMNLELLFEATKLSGDSIFHKVTVAYADRTLSEHFRPDGSCYHVVDYNISDGFVRHKQTAQGYADESVWPRGQAWAIYGFTIYHRETKDRKYLNQTLKTFDRMKNDPYMPEDLIPYWDMDAPNISDEPRDASSASRIVFALYEISTYDVPDAASYREYADRIMHSLALPDHRATLGTNGNFILMHSVSSIPHNNEVDTPLNYADYYFLETLKRRKDLDKQFCYKKVS